MEKFNEKLLDIFEVESISDDNFIEDFAAWDSLTLLSLIAVVDSDYYLQINESTFHDIKTIGQLKKYIQERIK